MDICPKCGLPKQACICEEIAKEEQRITIRTEKRRFGKITTIISGFDKGVNLKDLAKKLKAEMACGGTIRGNEIELQGDHTKKIKDTLVRLGFREDQINE